jgi:hypothetical protein
MHQIIESDIASGAVVEAASNLRPEVHGDLLIVARAKTIKIVAPERLPKDNTKMADVFRCRM